MTIPHRDRYEYTFDTFEVHEAYQTHGGRYDARTSPAGLVNREVQTGQKPTPCPQCFPRSEPKPVRRYHEPVITTEPSTDTDASVTVDPEPDSTTE